MSADSILRDKLFEEGTTAFNLSSPLMRQSVSENASRSGFLKKLFPLLEKEHTRHTALVALATITHHGGCQVLTEIAKHTPILVRLMRENEVDAKLLELAIVTISHAVRAVLLVVGKPPDPKIVKLIGLKEMLDVVLGSIRSPWISALSVTHAIPLLASPTLHCWDTALKHRDLLNFLAVCFRCEDLSVRCDAMSAFFHLHHHDANEDTTTLDPRRVLESYENGAFRRPHIRNAIVDYGFQDTNVFNTILAVRTFQSAMQKAVETRDLVDLGRTLARLVVQTEYSITDVTKKVETTNSGLPFTRWRDALPHCAEALQETGYASDIDMADILRIKYLIMTRELREAIPRAKAAIERSPQVPYFYYAIALGADMEEGLKYAKKGMQCKTITKFVHFGTVKRAIEFAANLGINAVVNPQYEGRGKELGVAFLTSAMVDAKYFITNAPPDSRHMPQVVDWYMLMTIILKGPELHMSLIDFGVSISNTWFSNYHPHTL